MLRLKNAFKWPIWSGSS